LLDAISAAAMAHIEGEVQKVLPTAGQSAKDIVAVVHSLALANRLDECVLDAA